MQEVTVGQVKAAGLAGPITAIVITLFRLGDRAYSRRLGLDDAFAALAAAILIVFVVALFIHIGEAVGQPIINATHWTSIAIFYVLATFFYGVTWSARLSILFSVIRISTVGPFRRALIALAAMFVIAWAVLTSQVFWTCESRPSWKNMTAPQCTLGQSVAIAQLITDILADAILIFAPLKLLWGIQASRAQRNRLIAVFSTSICTTVVSLLHAYVVLKIGGLEEIFFAIIEISVSLVVCNTAVLAAAFVRYTGVGSTGDTTVMSESHAMSKRSVVHVTTTCSHHVSPELPVDLRHVSDDSDPPPSSTRTHFDEAKGSPFCESFDVESHRAKSNSGSTKTEWDEESEQGDESQRMPIGVAV